MPNGDAAGAPTEPADQIDQAAPGPGPAGPGAPLGRAEQRVAIVLIAVFMLFVVVLVLMRSDEHWDRLVFLLGGVEAIVFAAAGALFGTSVQRTQAVEARQVATMERQRAERFEAQARSGQALADVIRAKAERATAPDGGDGQEQAPGRGARPDRGPLRAGAAGPGAGDRQDEHLAELAHMAERWFPQGTGGSR